MAAGAKTLAGGILKVVTVTRPDGIPIWPEMGGGGGDLCGDG